MRDESRNPFLPPSEPRIRVRLIAGLTLGVVALAAAITFAVIALAPPADPTPSGPATALPDVAAEQLALPPIGVEIYDWLNGLQMSLDGDARYGTVAISEDRETVTITWHGEPSDELAAIIDEAPDTITVALQHAEFLPGELNALVVRTPGLIPDFQVAMAGMENDGSGIWVGIVELPDGNSLADVGTAFAEALGRPDVPVRVELSGAVMPING